VPSEIRPTAAYWALVPGGTDVGPSMRMLCRLGVAGVVAGCAVGGVGCVGDLSHETMEQATMAVATSVTVVDRGMTISA